MDATVTAEEQITRYLVHSNEFKASKGCPSYLAYMPDRKGEKSVYRTSGLMDSEIAEIGTRYVEPGRSRLKGYSNQVAEVIFAQGLTVESDTRPHPRHANIKGWLTNDAANRIRAQKIAETASLKLYDKAGS